MICLAAQFSQKVYNKPSGSERETRVEGDWRHGTKAMVIKSVPVDNMNVIVFAIRGTQSFRDWTTNMNSEPAVPDGFLDDPGNLCHAGFLSAARHMVTPVARRLQQLLDENPSRLSCSLVITGHSAGGAIASLLYKHMLSQTLMSDLINLRNTFKRVHCITFGAPPVSLLPMDKPSDPKYKKWLFFSFINEGDPVPRAEKSYVRSLIDLYTSPAPNQAKTNAPSTWSASTLKFNILGGNKDRRQKKSSIVELIEKGVKQTSACDSGTTTPTPSDSQKAIWRTPPTTLSLAGSLILLRGSKDKPQARNRVEAFLTRDEDLRGIVFGDPMMHMMELYERRVEVLATIAVTGRFER